MPSVFSKFIVAAVAIGAVQALPNPRTLAQRDPTDNTELIAKLKTDPTVIKRYQRLLTKDGQQLLTGEELAKASTFDFQKDAAPFAGSQGGVANGANIETFPILIDSGITVNFANLGPCGVVIPHVHPRANEFFTVVEGEATFGYTLEAGLLDNEATPTITGKLTKYNAVLFPQGSVHWVVNNSPDCKPATGLVTLSSENAGANPILQVPAGTNATSVRRQADGSDVIAVLPILPPQVAGLVQECLARCNLA